MSLDKFEATLARDEDAVSRDQAKLQRDEERLDAFSSKLGASPVASFNTAPPDAVSLSEPAAGNPVPFGPAGGGGGRGVGMAVADPFVHDLRSTPPMAPQDFAPGVPNPAAITNAPPAVPPPSGDFLHIGDIGHVPPPQAPLAAPGRTPGVTYTGGPNLQKAIDVGNKAQLATFDDERRHKMQAANEHGAAVDAMSGMRLGEAERQVKEAKDAQATADDAYSKQTAYLNKSDEMNTALSSGHIDPNRLWHNADTGTKVAMGIAAFLGSIVPGVKPLANLIFGNAHDDTEAQKHDYDRQSQGMARRDNLYGHFVKASGDSALAKLQTRNALIEAQKISMQAQADRLGIPEALTNAKVGIDVLNREQKKLQTDIATRAKATADAQAAAGAAARAHAEQLAWSRGMQVAELGLKKDELGIKRLEAEAKSGEKTADIDKSYADRLLRGEVPQKEAAIQRLTGQITDKNGAVNTHKRIPGLGPLDAFRDKLLPTPGGLIDSTPGGRLINQSFGLSPDERMNRQSWDRLAFQYRHDVTGAGGSDAEADKITAAFAGANTPEEQAAALQMAQDTVQRIKNTAAQGNRGVIERGDQLNKMPAGARRIE